MTARLSSGACAVKKKPSPFDPVPNAWADAFIFAIALLFLAYALWVMWPVVATAWLFLTW